MKEWKDWTPGSKVLAIVGGSVGGIGLAALFGLVTMWLWNSLMPRIFHLPTIGYWEAWGLILLSSILFKSMPGGGGNRDDRRRKRMIRERMREEGPVGGETGE